MNTNLESFDWANAARRAVESTLPDIDVSGEADVTTDITVDGQATIDIGMDGEQDPDIAPAPDETETMTNEEATRLICRNLRLTSEELNAIADTAEIIADMPAEQQDQVLTTDETSDEISIEVDGQANLEISSQDSVTLSRGGKAMNKVYESVKRGYLVTKENMEEAGAEEVPNSDVQKGEPEIKTEAPAAAGFEGGEAGAEPESDIIKVIVQTDDGSFKVDLNDDMIPVAIGTK